VQPRARSSPRARQRAHERRDRRRRSWLAWAARILILVGVFFLGIALGRALEEAPTPGGEQTIVRTIVATTVAPEETTTVTVSSP
jgi:hypothetical protein